MHSPGSRKPSPGKPSAKAGALTRLDLTLYARNFLIASLLGRRVRLPRYSLEEIVKQFKLHPKTIRGILDSMPEEPEEPEEDRRGRFEHNLGRRVLAPKRPDRDNGLSHN